MRVAFTAVLGLVLFTMPAGDVRALEPADNPAFNFHRLFKRYMYATLTVESAYDVLVGTQQPLLQFAVLQDPPSLFVNFEVPPDKVGALAEYLRLPPGFALAPISIIEGEAPRMYLTLNIYAVSGLRGLLSGNRAEWSVYVKKDGGRTSFMIVDAKASALSLDAVNGFTRGTELRHHRTSDGIRSYVASDAGTTFQSLVTEAGLSRAERVYPEVAWIAANDRIYWRNGVSDRTYYAGDFVDTPVLRVPPEEIAFVNTTVWSAFVDPKPVSVVLYETGFELVISPWYNLDPESPPGGAGQRAGSAR